MDENKKEQRFAWFSLSHANLYGSCIYLTPEGKELEVTEVTSTWAKSEFTLPDSKFLGEVTTYVRECKKGKIKHPLQIAIDELKKHIDARLNMFDDPFDDL